jgi:hypothetical protein
VLETGSPGLTKTGASLLIPSLKGGA